MHHATHNPVTGKRFSWPYPHRWAPERGPEFRGDALPAVQAALGYYLQTKTRAVRSWEDKCSDTARAMDVSFMVDDEQQLVFVKIDEAPEKRCPDGPPREFLEGDGGVIVILQKPMAALVLDGINVYAVTFDGQILDEYRQGHPEFELPAADGGERTIAIPPFDSTTKIDLVVDGTTLQAIRVAADDFAPRSSKPQPCTYTQAAQIYKVSRSGDIIFVEVDQDPKACGGQGYALDSSGRYAISKEGRILRRILPGEGGGPEWTTLSEDAGWEPLPLKPDGGPILDMSIRIDPRDLPFSQRDGGVARPTDAGETTAPKARKTTAPDAGADHSPDAG